VFQDVRRQRRDGNKGIIGLMVESNMKEGQYKLPIILKDLTNPQYLTAYLLLIHAKAGMTPCI